MGGKLLNEKVIAMANNECKSSSVPRQAWTDHVQSPPSITQLHAQELLVSNLITALQTHW